MKRIYIIIGLIAFFAFSGNTQSIEAVRKAEDKVQSLQKKISKDQSALSFSKSQELRLQKVYLEVVQEQTKKDVSDLDKYNQYLAYKEIEDKYMPQVEKILTPEQKVVFKRIKAKQQ